MLRFMLSWCKQTDRQTDNGTTTCPRSFDAEAKKLHHLSNEGIIYNLDKVWFCRHVNSLDQTV